MNNQPFFRKKKKILQGILTHWFSHSEETWFFLLSNNICIHFNDRVPDPEGRLPEESLNASALKKCFQSKGLS